MNSSGWIKIHRRLQDDPIWTSETFTRGQAWIDMIMLASFEDGYIRVQGVRVDVKRGDLAWSEIALSQRWRWSRGKVRRFFSELEKDLKIAKKTVHATDKRKSVITILNYSKYQQDEKDHELENGTGDGQATDKRRYSIKEGKECKEEKDIVGHKPRQRIPFKEIIDFFNEITGKDFKPTTNGTKSHIRARWAEGFRVDDFKTVIQAQHNKWSRDDKMEQYVRPQTLFGTKFEAYLQAAKESGSSLKSKWVKQDA